LKLVRFQAKNGTPRLGAWLDEAHVVDLNKAYLASCGQPLGEDLPLGACPVEFFQKGRDAVEKAKSALEFIQGSKERFLREAVYESGEVKLLAPIRNPPKIIGLGGNYISHVREVRKDRPLPQRIFLFLKSSGPGVVGPDEPIVVPKTVVKLDYELELGVVIGKRGKHIPVDKAYDHIGGYTVFNDVCDRFFLMDIPSWDWFGMKAQDSFSVFGPCIETEIDDPNNLKMTLKVNDELRQDGHTGDMVFPVPSIVSYISQLVTLEVGDIIATGTCEGNAMTWGRRENIPSGGKWLKDGDTMEAWVENIGALRNTVKFEEPVYRS